MTWQFGYDEKLQYIVVDVTAYLGWKCGTVTNNYGLSEIAESGWAWWYTGIRHGYR